MLSGESIDQTIAQYNLGFLEHKFGQILGILARWAADNKLYVVEDKGDVYSYYEKTDDGYMVVCADVHVCEQFCEVKLWFDSQLRSFSSEPPARADPKIDQRLYLQTEQLYILRDVSNHWECIYCGYRERVTFSRFVPCRKCDMRRSVYKQTTESATSWLMIAGYIDLPHDLVLLIAQTLDRIGLSAGCSS